eukprot:m51a1_g11003 hypothetical protein (675) ;mRNA; f:358750-361490
MAGAQVECKAVSSANPTGDGGAAVHYESLFECAAPDANSVAASWDIRPPSVPTARDRVCLFIHNRKFVPLRTMKTNGSVRGACLFQGLTPGYYDVRLFLGEDSQPVARAQAVLVGPHVNVKAHVEGGEIIVTWTKPDGGACPGKGDWVGLYAPTKHSNKQYLAWRDASKSMCVRFPAPRVPGDYGVRYFLGEAGYAFSGRAVASVPRVDYIHVHPWSSEIHVAGKVGLRWVCTSHDSWKGTRLGLFSRESQGCAPRIAVPVNVGGSKRKDPRLESTAILDLSTVFLAPGDYDVKLYVERGGTYEVLCESPLVLCNVAVSSGNVPKPANMEDVVRLMVQYPDSPAYQETAMYYALLLLREDPAFKSSTVVTRDLVPLVVKTLRVHLFSPSICEIACQLLSVLAVHEGNLMVALENEVFESLLTVIERYMWSQFVLPPLTVLSLFLTNQTFLFSIEATRLVKVLMTIVFDHSQSFHIVEVVLKSLRHLSQQGAARDLIWKDCGVAAALSMMRLHPDSSQALENSSRLLITLCENNDEAKKEVAQRDGLPVLTSALKIAYKMPGACESLCIALAIVSKGNTYNRMQIAEQGGIKGLLRVLGVYYGTTATVTEAVCKALESLCQSWDCCFEFYAEKTPEVATHAFYALKMVWDTCSDERMQGARKSQLGELQAMCRIP